jgi:hypothetical protein
MMPARVKEHMQARVKEHMPARVKDMLSMPREASIKLRNFRTPLKEHS